MSFRLTFDKRRTPAEARKQAAARLNEVLTQGVRERMGVSSVPTIPEHLQANQVVWNAVDGHSSHDTINYGVATVGAKKGPKTKEGWRERRRLWILMGCLGVVLAGVAAVVLLLFLMPINPTPPPPPRPFPPPLPQPPSYLPPHSPNVSPHIPPPSATPPGIPASETGGTINLTMISPPPPWLPEFVCVNVTTPTTAVAALMNFVTSRRRLHVNVIALQQGLAALLPRITVGHVQVQQLDGYARCCVAADSDAHADNILDEMSDDTFLTALSRQPSLQNVNFLSDPELTLDGLIVPPPPPPPLLPDTQQPAHPPMPPPPSPPSPPATPPPNEPPSSPPPPHPPPPHVLLAVNDGDEPAQDVVVYSNVPTAIDFSGNATGLKQYNLVFWTRQGQPCETPFLPTVLGDTLDGDLEATFTLTEGVWQLCVRENGHLHHHPHVRAVVVPAPSPPPATPPPSTPPPSLPPPSLPPLPSSLPPFSCGR